MDRDEPALPGLRKCAPSATEVPTLVVWIGEVAETLDGAARCLRGDGTPRLSVGETWGADNGTRRARFDEPTVGDGGAAPRRVLTPHGCGRGDALGTSG